MRVGPDLWSRRERFNEPASNEHRADERLPTGEVAVALASQRDHIMVGITINLLRTRYRALFVAKLRGVAGGLVFPQLYQFVHDGQSRSIGRRGELCADSEGVDRCSGANDLRQPVFVQVVGSEN